MEVFRKLLHAAQNKLQKGERTRLQWNDGSVCCLMDEEGLLLYCVLTASLAYPERPAYKLLNEFMGEVEKINGRVSTMEHSLNQQLEPHMGRLLRQYEDPAVKMESLVMATTVSEAAVVEGKGRWNKTFCVILVLGIALIMVFAHWATKR